MTAALLAFGLTSTLLILAPGPDSLLVMRNTLRDGRRAGWVTACGTLSGLLAWVVAAALGLSALVRVSHLGYDLLRLAGASYLIWLGASSLVPACHGHARAGERACRTPGGARRGRLFRNGLLSDLLNPKIGVFFVAFLPGFIPAGASAMTFSLVLGLLFIAETAAWLAIVTWLVARGAGWLRRSAGQRWLERLTGLALIGFGLRLAAAAR